MKFAWGAYTYAGIFFFGMFSQTLLAQYLINNQGKLCFATSKLDKILKYKALRLNLILVPIAIIVLFGLNYLELRPIYAMYILAAYGIVSKRLSKKYYPDEGAGGPVLSSIFQLRKKIFTNRRRNTELVNKK